MDVSIIIPIFNNQENINTLLDNLHRQSKINVEFILINDGSTDKTDLLIESKLNSIKDRRFFYCQTFKNHGVSNARNLGITLSSGKYIIFVDSDDSFPSDFVSRYFDAIEHNGTDIEFFSVGTLSGKRFLDYTKLATYSYMDRDDLLSLYCEQRLRSYLFSFISKSSLWSSVRFDLSYSYQEDTLALLNILLRNNNVKAHFNSDEFYIYNDLNYDSATKNLSIGEYRQSVEINNKIIHLASTNIQSPKLIGFFYAKSLSESMDLSMHALAYKKISQYKFGRNEFLTNYKKSIWSNHQIHIKRFLQYCLLLLDLRRILLLIYSNLI